ncbi:helix-turn-helix domain-containing protein [Peterkaempfera bronchialis]|uniref:helix-turn-helix domain-containing protein n=1 Tax=Peterkaempfera bronchialis TaxID=2126346 RepID=UPI003C2B3F52
MTTRREPNPDATGPSLSQLLRLIDPGILDVVAAPRGTDIPVADVVLHDPGEDRDEDRAASGLVLLVVGVEAASPDAEDVLRAADRAGAAAVVMRRGTRGPRAALVAAAESGRTALLTRHPDRDWTEVLGRLRTALAHSAASGSAAVAGLRLGDLSGLANTVADLVGGAITIEDPQSRVLAYSRMDHEPDPMRRLTILGQEVPRWRVAELRESGFFQALWSTDDVVRRPADDRYAERLAIAVRHGSEVLGSLWAAADGRPLAEGAAAALRTAARAAVPHLVHHEAWGRAAARRREEAVQALLEGRPDAEQAARTVGVAPDRPHTVLVAEAHDTRALDAAAAPAADGAAELVVRVLRGRASAVGAASAVSASAVSDDVASEVALLKVLDRVEPLWQAMSGPVHAMVAHDCAHGSEYGASVTAYLHAFGDIGAAAQRLNVHPNTLRYRLRRARELFGVDLTDPTGRLLADIGLRLAPRLE